MLVRLYSTLLADRATLQKEVMREYNVKFVHPTIFKQKRDVSTMTESRSSPAEDGQEEERWVSSREGIERGSGRKVVKKRQSRV